MSKKNLIAYLYLTAAMIVVSGSFPAGKLAVSHLPVFLLSGGRYLVAMFLMVPVLCYGWKDFRAIARKDMFLLIMQAFFGVWVFNIFLFWGLNYIPAANSGIILGIVPSLVLMLSRFFHKEHITRPKMIGLALAFSGIWVLSPNNSTLNLTENQTFIGFSLVLIAAIGEALFLFISKATSSRINPYISASLISIFGFIMILPFAAIEAMSYDFRLFTRIDGMIIIYFGIVITFLGYVLWFSGTARVPHGTSAFFTTVMPVSAVFLSALILDEKLTIRHYFALCLIVSAILISIFTSPVKQVLVVNG